MNRTVRRLIIPGVGVILATSGFAFMASNSFDSNASAGESVQTVNGYDVYGTATQLCASSGKLCGVQFDIFSQVKNEQRPQNVQVRAMHNNQALSGWVTCTTADRGSNAAADGYGAGYSGLSAAFCGPFTDLSGNTGVDNSQVTGFDVSASDINSLG